MLRFLVHLVDIETDWRRIDLTDIDGDGTIDVATINCRAARRSSGSADVTNLAGVASACGHIPSAADLNSDQVA
jgi:hypothetical protein